MCAKGIDIDTFAVGFRNCSDIVVVLRFSFILSRVVNIHLNINAILWIDKHRLLSKIVMSYDRYETMAILIQCKLLLFNII